MHGIIIGKFLVFHCGHKYLIDTASELVDNLTILVCTLKDEPIDGFLRYNWIKNQYAYNNSIKVNHIKTEIKDASRNNADAHKIWSDFVKLNVSNKIDFVISSESYGDNFAKELGCKSIVIDLQRNALPISSTSILQEPFKYWFYITQIARSFFVKEIYINSDELSKKLACIFKTFSIDFDDIYFSSKLIALKNQADKFVFIFLKDISLKNNNKNIFIDINEYTNLDEIVEFVKKLKKLSYIQNLKY